MKRRFSSSVVIYINECGVLVKSCARMERIPDADGDA